MTEAKDSRLHKVARIIDPRPWEWVARGASIHQSALAESLSKAAEIEALYLEPVARTDSSEGLVARLRTMADLGAAGRGPAWFRKASPTASEAADRIEALEGRDAHLYADTVDRLLAESQRQLAVAQAQIEALKCEDCPPTGDTRRCWACPRRVEPVPEAEPSAAEVAATFRFAEEYRSAMRRQRHMEVLTEDAETILAEIHRLRRTNGAQGS